MTVGFSEIAIAAWALGMFVLGHHIAVYGLRKVVSPVTFEGTRRGLGCATALVLPLGVAAVLSPDSLSSLPIAYSVGLPFAALIAAVVGFRVAYYGTWNILVPDMDTMALIYEIEWRLIKWADPPRELDEFIEALRQPLTSHADWRVRRFAAWALGHAQSPTAFWVLLAGMEDADCRVQLASIRSAGRVGMALTRRGRFTHADGQRLMAGVRCVASTGWRDPQVAEDGQRLLRALAAALGPGGGSA